jgi:predicted transcriptional regulator
MTEAADGQGFRDDAAIRERLLSLLYVQRRQNMRQPGIGEMELARLIGIPHEHLEFHLWYLKESGWIQRLDTGLHAITAQGVDEVERRRTQRRAPERLIESRARADGDETLD